jgi:hypothetical protein
VLRGLCKEGFEPFRVAQVQMLAGIPGHSTQAPRAEALTAWREIAAALGASGSAADRQLARSIHAFAAGMDPAPAHERPRALTDRPAPSRKGPSR